MPCQSFAIPAQTVEDFFQSFRCTAGVSLIKKLLVRPAQIQMELGFHLRVRRCLLEQGKKILLQSADQLQPFFGRIPHLGAHIGGERCFLGQQSLLGHVMQGANDPPGFSFQRRIVAGGSERMAGRQLIGAESLVARFVHQKIKDIKPAFLLALGEMKPLDVFRGFFQVAHQYPTLKNHGVIFIAQKKTTALQPGNGGFHPGVVIAKLFKVDIHGLGPHQLPGGQHQLIAFSVSGFCSDAAQQLGNVPLTKTRTAAQAELPFNILLSENKDTFGCLTVAPRPARFLQVIFQ